MGRLHEPMEHRRVSVGERVAVRKPNGVRTGVVSKRWLNAVEVFFEWPASYAERVEAREVSRL